MARFIRIAMLAAAAAPVVLLSGPAPAQQIKPIAVGATLDYTRQFDLHSKINGESYRIQMSIPAGPPPSAGYPVIYVLDGNIFFGTFAGAMRRRALAGELDEAIVVGIEDGEGPNSAIRTLDCTYVRLPLRDRTIMKEFTPQSKTGGGEEFLRVIQAEIEPTVAAFAPIDQHRKAIFGWSLAGLFVVRTMLAHPEAFETYLATSPSLWFADREAFGRVAAFERNVALKGLHPRLFIGVGKYEQDPSVNYFPGELHDIWAGELSHARMVDNARDMHSALAPLFRSRPNDEFFRIFQDDTHASVNWNAINPVLNFSFGRGVFAEER
ncbi:alpha/beta hydrolase-fold protein [Acetobacteraceae bacterium KSS8]|uniref:Alpha/beta hydrolase-fold protein n=1 Tax=Endosaccharibacter trunci TaxID=2812733 RepID=A0ABT1W417_9PROT|nr:alpha/beta hydrolase-fold protein [Acetobacteraceae bacterium KSS8]